MKTLIISISGYNGDVSLTVCINGVVYRDLDKEGRPFWKACYDKWFAPNKEIFAPFLKDYDFVVVCENGEIEVLKGTGE